MKFLFGLLVCFISVAATAQDAELVVIGNQKGAPATIKFSELKSILKCEQQRWHNGSKVSVAVMKPNTDIGKLTCEKILQLSATEANKFWALLSFAGKEGAPHTFSSVTDLQNYVSQNPGAIGIISKSDNLPDTQVIMIDGKKTI